MAESESCNKKALELDLASSNSNIIAFHFNLPEDGLALRSARVVNGIPQLVFDASPKVPTLQEGDVATAFRLAEEDKRPEFFYRFFPPTHPLHHSRYFKQYSPAWLRWTGIGTLLAEADWNMKCLHVGVRTNEEKTVFKSWPRSSQLQGLATHLDFPRVQSAGSIFLSCEHAKVQKDDNEIRFPEEPKMQIRAESSPLYSEYITKNYNSVAYYDEPKFLKMQELIKLILAVEWLYKDKGVRMNQQWIMMHTSKKSTSMKAENRLELRSRRGPPYKMIPRPVLFKRPSSDVTVGTWEAEMYRILRTEYKMQRRYGYYDFGGSEVIMFKEDGTKCPTRKSLKFSLVHTGTDLSFKGWLYLPMAEDDQVPKVLTDSRDELRQLLPKSSHEIVTYPMPMSVDTTVDIVTNEDDSELEMKITNSIHFRPPLALPPRKETTIVTVTVDNYNKLFANMDPNEPVVPAIPGVCEAIVPGVESWEELISELSVPFPRIWQAPFFGIGEPTATGGVATSSIPVREEPLRKRVVTEKTEWKDNYKRSGLSLTVRAVEVTAQGKFLIGGICCYLTTIHNTTSMYPKFCACADCVLLWGHNSGMQFNSIWNSRLL